MAHLQLQISWERRHLDSTRLLQKQPSKQTGGEGRRGQPFLPRGGQKTMRELWVQKTEPSSPLDGRTYPSTQKIRDSVSAFMSHTSFKTDWTRTKNATAPGRSNIILVSMRVSPLSACLVYLTVNHQVYTQFFRA